LEEANDMFEMYIYTMGGQDYADQIAELLDPDGMYFPFRVISGSDGTTSNKKALDIVFGPEKMMIILDDSENVSSNHHFIVSFC
jgi:TFIIF-interacting CTD phosphatase-like protein